MAKLRYVFKDSTRGVSPVTSVETAVESVISRFGKHRAAEETLLSNLGCLVAQAIVNGIPKRVIEDFCVREACGKGHYFTNATWARHSAGEMLLLS